MLRLAPSLALEERGYEHDEKDDQKNKKQNSRHAGRGRSHAAKSKNTGDQGDHCEDKRPGKKHVRTPEAWIEPGGSPPLSSAKRSFPNIVAPPKVKACQPQKCATAASSSLPVKGFLTKGAAR
jgi:hypothetical protein